MKEDKGLLLFNKQTWAQLAFEKLSAQKLQSVLSIRQEQFLSYNSIFKKEQLVIDDASLNMAGPLLGILSAHLCFPKENLVVLACDLPHMQPAVLKELLDQFVNNERIEAITFKFDERTEPLCGIYTAKGLARILSLHRKKKLNKFSMMRVLETLETKYILDKESWSPFFKNFNSPDDLIVIQ